MKKQFALTINFRGTTEAPKFLLSDGETIRGIKRMAEYIIENYFLEFEDGEIEYVLEEDEIWDEVKNTIHSIMTAEGTFEEISREEY